MASARVELVSPSLRNGNIALHTIECAEEALEKSRRVAQARVDTFRRQRAVQTTVMADRDSANGGQAAIVYRRERLRAAAHALNELIKLSDAAKHTNKELPADDASRAV